MNAQSSDGGVGGREGVKYALLPFPLAFGSWTIVREWKGKVIMRLEMALSATSQFFYIFFSAIIRSGRSICHPTRIFSSLCKINMG